MFKSISLFFLFAIGHLNAYNPKHPEKVSSGNSSLPSFTQNKGQVSDQNSRPRTDVLFSGMAQGMVYHLRKDGVSYQLNKVSSWEKKQVSLAQKKKRFSGKDSVPGMLSIYRIDINWPGINSDFSIETDSQLSGYNNYYLPVCPNGIHDVKTYAGITYKNIYEGIDLHYYGTANHLKYDYLLAPFADYKQIKLEVKGVEKITVESDGSLLLHTPLGVVKEGAPLVYQNNKQISAAWKVKGAELSFDIGAYDKTQPLVIDPATRLWGTYYGSASADVFMDCTVDALGNAYAVGSSFGATGTIIATSGSYQSTAFAGSDGTIIKFNSAGVRLWGTYYGGSAGDWIEACTTDNSGNIHIVGSTNTPSGIFDSPGCYQSVSSGGFRDFFVAKFTSAGMRLWGTYYGGSQTEDSPECAVDNSGNLYVSGITTSSDNISSPASHQPIHAGGSDAFLVKFDLNGARQWATYYGDVHDDGAFGCVADANGDVYMAGFSEDYSTVIGTPGSHQPLNSLGDDAILIKFNTNGTRLWGTYYGGYFSDWGLSCDIDTAGNVYMAGICGWGSNTGIATPGCYQPSHGGNNDCFLVKFTSAGTRLWGTYYGDTGADFDAVCSVNEYGYITLSGGTTSAVGSGIASPGSYQSTFGGGFYDVFLAQFDPSGVRVWGNYYGGYGDEGYASSASGPGGDLYLSGYTNTSTGTSIATPGSYQDTYAGTYQSTEGFLVKFSACDVNPPLNIAASNTFICAGNTITLTTAGFGVINWYDSSALFSVSSGASYITPVLTAGTYTYYADVSTCSSSSKTSIILTVGNLPQITLNSGTICAGETFLLVPSGAVTYTFHGPGPLVSPTITSSYSVAGTDNSGCTSNQSGLGWVTVNPLPSVGINATNSFICVGESSVLYATGALTYSWSTGDFSDSVFVAPLVNTIYTVTGNDVNACVNSYTFSLQVIPCTSEFETNGDHFSPEIYPNPNSGEFVIKIKSNSKIEITNVLGQLFEKKELTPGENYISIASVPNAVYLIRIICDEKISTFKIVKQ